MSAGGGINREITLIQSLIAAENVFFFFKYNV